MESKCKQTKWRKGGKNWRGTDRIRIYRRKRKVKEGIVDVEGKDAQILRHRQSGDKGGRGEMETDRRV